MPIRADLRHLYRGAAWDATRERIRARAGDRCERCGKPNGAPVETIVGKMLVGLMMHAQAVPYMFWRYAVKSKVKRPWHSWDGRTCEHPVPAPNHLWTRARRRYIVVVCVTAHLNHTPGDDRDENLAWLCQWCHFHHDAASHRETRATRKDAARPILVATREVA